MRVIQHNRERVRSQDAALGTRRHAKKRPLVVELLGQSVYLGEHVGNTKYRPYVVRCPLACTDHAEPGIGPCQKYRGSGVKMCEHFGAKEPLGYLGGFRFVYPRF